MEGKEYADRACCESDGTEPSASCPVKKQLDAGVTVGIVAAGVVVLCCICGCCFCCNTMRMSRNQVNSNIPASAAASETKHVKAMEPEINLSIPYDGMSIMHPSAPANPVFDGTKY